MLIFRNGCPKRKLRPLLLLVTCLLASGCLAADDIANPPARPSPQWLRDGVVYEIFPRGFSRTGDFNGITARLDELQDLGVNVLWLMPIHPIGVKGRKGGLGSPYAVRDYYAINPDYGTEADLKRLLSEAHRRGMKVILDLVVNHTSWDSVLMSHPEFYKHDAAGRIIPPVPEWTDVAGLNYDNPALRDYIIAMMKHWVDPATFDVDGFRCDVAPMVPTAFWEQARAELSKVKPDIMMLAEASKPELLTNAFDIDYSWPLLATLNNVLLAGAPAGDIRRSWEDSLGKFPEGALHLRISDDHDEARAVARFGVRGALAASALMFTLDGVPLLYNGMEVGDATESGDPALFERMPVFWDPKERPPVRAISRDLIKLRKSSPAFTNHRVDWLRNSNEADLVTLVRQDDRDQFLVEINFSNRPLTATVNVDYPREFKSVPIAGQAVPQNGDPSHVHLNGFEWRVYHRILPPLGETLGSVR
jgi:cyclomaltodextrinase